PAAEADADVGAVRDLERALIPREVAEDAPRDAAQLGHRRVVGGDADAGPQLLRDPRRPPDEVRVVLPQLLGADPPPVRERPLEALARPVPLPGLEAEGTGGRAAARGLPRRAPDPVPHVRVRGVADAGRRQVAQVGEVLLDLRVAPGE